MVGKVTKKQAQRKANWEKRFAEELAGEYELLSPFSGESHSRVGVRHIPCGYIRDTEARRLFTQKCPVCNRRSSLEDRAARYLNDRGIKYQREVRIRDCRRIRPLAFDFILYRDGQIACAIEMNGKQHYKRGKSWGGEKEMKKSIERDSIKNNYCKENKISLYTIDYTDDIENKIESILLDKVL